MMRICNVIFLLSSLALSHAMSFDFFGTTPGDVIAADVSIPASTAEDVVFNAIPSTAAYLLLQTHAQRAELQVTQAGDDTVQGRHVGVVVRPMPGQVRAGPVQITNPTAENVTVFVAVTVYGNRAPVPGGCSQTEPVPVAPYLRTETDHKAYTTLTMSRAELAVNRSVAFTCDAARGALLYRTYVRFTDRDLRSNYTQFRQVIVDMMTAEGLQTNAKQVWGREPAHPMRLIYALYPATSAVYGAAVSVRGVPSAVAAYVPTIRHACTLPAENYCQAYPVWVDWLLACLLILSGALLLTLAAVSLTVEVIVSTTLMTGGLWALLFRLVASDDFLASVGVGAGVGLLCALMFAQKWTWGHWSSTTMLLSTSTLFGTTFITVLLMAPVVQVPDMTYDSVFWPAFVLGSALVVIVGMLCRLEKSGPIIRNITGCLTLMTGTALLIGAVYPYTFVNLYRRALYPDFRHALLTFPVHRTDWIWAGLTTALIAGSLIVSCLVSVTRLSPRREFDKLPRYLRLPLLYPPAEHWERVGERAPLLPEAGPGGQPGGGLDYGGLMIRSPLPSA